jgi:hypothetical protein
MGTTRPLEARAAAPAAVEPLRNSRREAVVREGEDEEFAVGLMDRGWSVTVGSPVRDDARIAVGLVWLDPPHFLSW